MKVAFATAELSPHAQVGGLGDVAAWLPRALAANGDDVRVFVPRYDVMELDGEIEVPVGEAILVGSLGTISCSTLGPERPGEPTVYLVHSDRWFQRGAIYGSAGDDHLRFGALTAAVIAICDAVGWVPDVFHSNDWHTALLPLHAEAAGGRWASIPTVFTIHNLAHQGVFSGSDLEMLGLVPDAGEVNSMRVGLERSDMVTTVSPTFVREITRPGQGMGLDGELAALGSRLVGILNGIGDDWNPETDEFIPFPFSDPAGKPPNTAALRAQMGLNDRPGTPVLGIVSRLDYQKGFDLLEPTLPPLLADGRVQLAVLGRGDPAIESMFSSLAGQYPGEVAVEHAFDRALGHLIEAGADMFLMPSRFEPSGLNQMYSMAYGTIPIVHRTGGLANSVTQWTGHEGTGFLFDDFSPAGFLGALDTALAAFADEGAWAELMANGMAEDFSWAARAAEYRAVYDTAIDLRR
jgi:starch synthase